MKIEVVQTQVTYDITYNGKHYTVIDTWVANPDWSEYEIWNSSGNAVEGITADKIREAVKAYQNDSS